MLIQNFELISPWCRYTANGGNKIARITSNTVLVEGSLPAFLSALNCFTAFFTSFTLSFFSFLLKLLNSVTAVFTWAGTGSVGTVEGNEADINEVLKTANASSKPSVRVNFCINKSFKSW